MERTHYGQHEGDCFGCKLVSVQFGNVEAPPERLIEAQRAKDLPAYQSLRHQGLQPKATKGCHELATHAHTQFEIDMHGLVEPTLWKKTGSAVTDTMQMVREGMRDARDMGVTTQDVKQWKDDQQKKAS